jgi:membrane associated rhomboid family serine protease
MYFILIPYPIKAKYVVPGIIVIDLFLGLGGFEGDPIAHFAHLGGAITGFVIVKFWFSKYFKRGW